MPRAPDKQIGPDRSPGRRQPLPTTTSIVTTGSKDRWHQLADAIAKSNMAASDKSVFRFLLERADWATAVLPPKYTPVRKVIARATSTSYRQVTYSIQHLRRHNWLTTSGSTGPGKPLVYTLDEGVWCDCSGRVHDHRPHIERWQPEPSTVATFGHRSVATNGGNAAGQNVWRTGGMRGRTEEERGNGKAQQPEPPWADPSWPRNRDGQKLSFADTMEHYGQDPWK